MSRVYIAAAREDRPRAEALRDKLLAAGHIVTSTWHDGPPLPPHDGEIAATEEGMRVAMQCEAEMGRATVFVCIEPADGEGRGVLIECGYALGRLAEGYFYDGVHLLHRKGVERRSVLLSRMCWTSEAGLLRTLGDA